MHDLRNELPADDQYGLLAAHGFAGAFGGLWMERDDRDEIAHILRADPLTRHDAALAECVRRQSGLSRPLAIWIGPHAPGWSVVVNLLPVGGALTDKALWSEGRRAVEVSWLTDIDGLYDLDYYHDGRLAEELPAFWDGNLPPDSVFAPHTTGLVRDYGDDADEKDLTAAFLTITGRITGRFIDTPWFSTPGSAYDLLPRGHG
ncbi:hypothetical protein [Spongiactinospora sp. TRM90649]|uniref:hypothetical protein n=1 Tax=Spongiactinospora sp. TRM90649 TaxID=3031114 RepID=UPI0023F64A3E|nr:hypothetical protein [Spongiactinospora sp. TRM90649]MDF5756097.1 hypothetical protein [Spongiactinospora sp. TRM90649]